MLSIAEWLKNPNYESGVHLYEQHGANSFLKLKFKAGISDFNVAKLREELGKIAESSKSEAESVETAQPVRATQTSTPNPEPKRYLQLLSKRTSLYAQLNMLMEQKHHLPEGENLRVCAMSILSTYRHINELWAQIDYYQEHQCFPDDDRPVKPAIEPKKEMQLLRQTISKAKKRLLSPTCRDQKQTEKLKADSETRLAELVALKNNKV